MKKIFQARNTDNGHMIKIMREKGGIYEFWHFGKVMEQRGGKKYRRILGAKTFFDAKSVRKHAKKVMKRWKHVQVGA